MGTIDKKAQIREAKKREMSPVQRDVVAKMKKGLDKIGWHIANRTRRPKSSRITKDRNFQRQGRPTLIHSSYNGSTFVGDVKEHFRFGPAFDNKDRRRKLKANKVVKQNKKTATKQEVTKKARTGWDKFKNFFNVSRFKTREHARKNR